MLSLCASGRGHDGICDERAGVMSSSGEVALASRGLEGHDASSHMSAGWVIPGPHTTGTSSPKWEVQLDKGWTAWKPGVSFCGTPREKITFTMGGFPMEATFDSEDTGVQVNLQTHRQRALRRTVLSCIRPHEFYPFTCLEPTWCSRCKTFLWGLSEQGVRCSRCAEVRCHSLQCQGGGCTALGTQVESSVGAVSTTMTTEEAWRRSIATAVGGHKEALSKTVYPRREQDAPSRGGYTATPKDADFLVVPAAFSTLHDAFVYCQPNASGLITDRSLFAAVAFKLAKERGDVSVVWSHLDQDGNGAVSFPEFVEWAEAQKVKLPTGVGGGDVGVAFPATWTGPRDEEHGLRKWNCRQIITDSSLLAELQGLLDSTYKNKKTRDRKSIGPSGGVDVPKRFELARAERSENYHDWRGYYLKRHLIERQLKSDSSFDKYKPLTATANSLCGSRHRLRGHLNEWFLFHGTTAAAAESICKGDFTMKLAGSATGTMYGAGTYLAESITKADEYAKEDRDGLCAVLVCRVMGGKVLYSDEHNPDAASLTQLVLSAGYHSIIGDREKIRGTFKEYIVFDADQIYVEYILFYRRHYT